MTLKELTNLDVYCPKSGLNPHDCIGVQLVDIGSTTTMTIEPQMTLKKQTNLSPLGGHTDGVL